MTDPNQTQATEQEVQVDEKAITRQSIFEGFKSGAMNGLKWGGIGTAVLTAGATFVGIPMMGKAAVGTTGWLATLALKFPLVGAPIAAAAAWIFKDAAVALTEGGIPGLAIQMLAVAGKTFLTVGLPIIAASALIGGVIGAVKGYNNADARIEQAKREELNRLRQLELEKAQALKHQRQLSDANAQLANQTQELYAGADQIGQFSPGTTPNTNNNNELGDNRGPQNVIG